MNSKLLENIYLKKSIILDILILIIITIYLLFVQPSYIFNTFFLLLFVMYFGEFNLNKVKKNLKEPKIILINYFWAFKIFLTFFLLEYGWIYNLLSNIDWGYDPQRFYEYSQNLIKTNWVVTDNLNYNGVTYFYAVVFYIFGINPYIPALINNLITIIALLNLFNYLKVLNIKNVKYIWLFFLILLSPEAVWFDIITSREMLLASLLCIITVEFSKFCFFESNNYKRYISLLIIILIIFAISALRFTVIIPIFFYFFIIFLSTNLYYKIKRIKLVIILFIIAIPLITPLINLLFGGFEINYLELFVSTTNSSENIASIFDFSGNSISYLLMPNSFLQSILFLPLRIIVYLISPLPATDFSFTQLYARSFYAWQNMLVSISSILNVILFPFCISGLIDSFKNRITKKREFSIHLSYFIFIATVAGGNLIIVDRYRIMCYMLMITSAWISYYSSPKSLNKIINFSWYTFLITGSIFYITYKILH